MASSSTAASTPKSFSGAAARADQAVAASRSTEFGGDNALNLATRRASEINTKRDIAKTDFSSLLANLVEGPRDKSPSIMHDDTGIDSGNISPVSTPNNLPDQNDLGLH